MTTCCSSSRSIVHRGLVSVLVVSALCAAAFVGGEGAGVPATSRGLDPAALFPASTVMTLSIDGGPCTEHAKELAISKIWNEPEVQEFLKGSLDLLKEQAETNIKGFTAQLGITPADLDQLAKIRITFAVTQFKLAEGGMSGMPTVDLMLAVDLKGQQKTMEALLKMLEAAAGAGEEGAIKEATVGGIPARMIPVPPGGPFTGVTYLFHEGWLLAGTSTAQLEAAVTRAKSGDLKGSLASNASYAASMKEVARPKSILSFYLDYSVVTGFLEAADQPGMKEMMGASGLGSMKAVAFGMDLDGASIHERSFAAMAPNSPFMQFTMPVDPAGILARIPKRSILASMGSVNLRGIYEYFKKVMGAVPMAGEMLDEGMAEVDKILGATWKDDLLPNLGPEYGIFIAAAQFGLVPDVGAIIKVGNRAKIEGAVAKMLEGPEAKAAVRSVKFLDSTINYMDLGAMGIDKDLNLRPAWVFVDDYVLLTMCPHAAKSVLAAWAQKDGGLLAREDFARSFSRLKAESPNAGNTGIGYLDAQWLAGFLLDNAIPLVQSAVSPKQLQKLGPFALDLGKLPSTQAITRHLSCIIMQGQTKEGGTYTEFVSPMGIIGTAVAIGAGAAGVMSARMAGEMIGGETAEPSEHGARHKIKKAKERDKTDKDEDKDK